MSVIRNPQEFPTAAKQFYAIPLTRRGKQIARVIRQMERLHARGVEPQNAPVNAPNNQVHLHPPLHLVQQQPVVPAATRFGSLMQGVGLFFRTVRETAMNLVQAFRERRLERLERREAHLHNRLNALITSYLHDFYRTDIYQRYEKAVPEARTAMLDFGRGRINEMLEMLAINNLGIHHNAIRFNRPFFSACGWSATSVVAGSVFGAAALKTLQITSNIWTGLQTNNLPLIGASVTPELPVAAVIAGAAVMAYSIWRLSDSVKAYIVERNAWIVSPIRESAQAALDEAQPLRR